MDTQPTAAVTTELPTATVAIIEPSILTADVSRWKPQVQADNRRRAERKRGAEVAAFFQSLGLEVESPSAGIVVGKLTRPRLTIETVFNYAETCSKVRKSFSVTRNGKHSNITALRKLAV